MAVISADDGAGISLTGLEARALRGSINLADGHPRQRLTPSQQQIISLLPAIFRRAQSCDYFSLERGVISRFAALAGTSPILESRDAYQTYYSSSVATEVTAVAMRERGIENVLLVEPTFDNIPILLRRAGLSVIAVPESGLLAYDENLLRHRGMRTALFLVSPNNPTGAVVPQSVLSELGTACARMGFPICIDATFALLDPEACFDRLGVLRGTGVDYIVVEDTGKLWPTLEQKVGMTFSSPSYSGLLKAIHDDVLLQVSPLSLGLLQAFLDDAVAGGLAMLRGLIAERRGQVRHALNPVATFPDVSSRVSVERVTIPGRRSEDMYDLLRSQDVHVLTTEQFHWADSSAAPGTLRLSLARDPEVLAAGLRAILDLVEVA